MRREIERLFEVSFRVPASCVADEGPDPKDWPPERIRAALADQIVDWLAAVRRPDGGYDDESLKLTLHYRPIPEPGEVFDDPLRDRDRRRVPDVDAGGGDAADPG